MPSKYQYLLKDDDVRRWFENLNTRSVITATVSLRTLGLFRKMRHTTPREIVTIINTTQFKDEFTASTSNLMWMEKSGKTTNMLEKPFHPEEKLENLIFKTEGILGELFITTRQGAA